MNTYDAVFQPYQAVKFQVEMVGKDKTGLPTFKLMKVVARLTFSVDTKAHILVGAIDISDSKGEDYVPGLTVSVAKDLKVEFAQSSKQLLGKDNCVAVVDGKTITTNGDLAIAAIDVLAADYEPTWFKNKVEPMSLLLQRLYESVKTDASGANKNPKISVEDLTAAFAAVNTDSRVKRLGDTPLMAYCKGAEGVMKQQTTNGTKETTAPTKA